jgi:hypothetical protein
MPEPGDPDAGGTPPGADAGSSLDAGPTATPDAGGTRDSGSAASPDGGGLGFATPAPYTIGTQNDGFIGNAASMNVVTADFNGDGKLDLAVVHVSDETVFILLNKGDGTFEAPAAIPINETLSDLFVADFNGDGKLDLALPGGSGPSTPMHTIVLLGKGDGTFGPKIDSSEFMTGSRGVAVGDFNGDGKLDFVATTQALGGLNVLLGNGDGTFQKALAGPSGQFNYARWVTAADFDGDGKLDVAVADGQGDFNDAGTAEITVLLGKGDGTFAVKAHYPSPPTVSSWGGAPPPVGSGPVVNPEDIFAVDVNGDGKLDLIESLYDHNINVFLGNGDGTFHDAVGYITGEYPRAVAVADMNGDGIVDLVVCNVGCLKGTGNCSAAPGSVAVMIGNGGGTFQAPVVLRPFQFPEWVAIGDFNGDGRPDLAITSVQDDHTLDILLNQSSP